MKAVTNSHICSKTDQKEKMVIQNQLSQISAEIIANWFKAFSDINRVKIGFLLLRQEELCVHDISQLLNLSIANTSHHLRLMKTLGITSTKKQGTTVLYSLKDEHVKEILNLSFMHLLEEN